MDEIGDRDNVTVLVNINKLLVNYCYCSKINILEICLYILVKYDG